MCDVSEKKTVLCNCLACEIVIFVHCQLSSFRFGWRGQSRDSIGTVFCVDDGGILRVGFPGASRGWRADPAEIEHK